MRLKLLMICKSVDGYRRNKLELKFCFFYSEFKYIEIHLGLRLQNIKYDVNYLVKVLMVALKQQIGT